MIRPTQEEVDEALRTVREEEIGGDDPTVLLDVLADEVVALREELASNEAYAATLFAELEHERNAIGRVDTLLTLLEQDSVLGISAAGQIRQALRGES